MIYHIGHPSVETFIIIKFLTILTNHVNFRWRMFQSTNIACFGFLDMVLFIDISENNIDPIRTQNPESYLIQDQYNIETKQPF